MYVPLKITTDYSILKSLIKIDDLITFLNEKKISSCGICDENLYGSFEFYNKCLKNNIKPIIGLSIKLNNNFLYLYAINYQGYKNLLKINTIKETREITIEDLLKYKDNILIIIPYKSIDLYKVLSFYNYVYLGYSNLYEKNNSLLLSNNIVYIKDLRALKEEDTKYLKYLSLLNKEEIDNEYFYEDNINDTGKISEIVNLIDIKIPSGNKYIPKYTNDSAKFLEDLAYKGLNKRLKGKITTTYKNRLDYELAIIKKMGFVDYFLIVYDYVLYAKKNSILVGPGRGSAAGSLISYVLGIIDIDPLKYNLLFERFLNPERITMPDIDIDFDATKRDVVINYVKEKYGQDKVALGITFNTLKSKLVLREVGKILKIDSHLIDKFVGEINANLNLMNNLKNEKVKKYLNNYHELQELYKISLKLEGLKKNISTHAAGVVISSITLDEVIPIHYNNQELITGITMEYLEDIGLLKMDFLGLKNLTTIANILKLINKPNLNDIDLEKKEVYKMFCAGKTEGIFQLETKMMQDLCMKLKPNCFNDLIALIALGRPGPKDQANSYIKRKNNEEAITYLHPDLEPILKETYGIIIYQEQIMAILRKFANYTLAQADIVRRAISKKKEEILISEENKFIELTKNNGYEENLAKEIFNLIVKFASYGFNKSHSVAYALICYQMGYLKCFYSQYFIVNLLNESTNNIKNTYYLNYLKNKNIKLYKPSINNPNNNYFIDESKLILPLWIIKNISKEISNQIIANRKSGYIDIFDFAYKNKEFLTKGLLEILIRAGALDDFKINHKTLIMAIDRIFNYLELASDDFIIEKPLLVEYKEYESSILMNDEINSYGFFITNHPASKYMGKYLKIANINKYLFKNIISVILIDKIKVIKTKKGTEMAFLEGSDETGVCEFILFPEVYKKYNDLHEKELIMLNGKVEKRFDKTKIIVNNIKRVGGLNE